MDVDRLSAIVDRAAMTPIRPPFGVLNPNHAKFYVHNYGGTLLISYGEVVDDSSNPGHDQEMQRGRKFHISPYSTDEEVLRTMHLAVRVWYEHEINERFRVDGELFLNPHPEGARPDERT